jgi:hypothetical protein
MGNVFPSAYIVTLDLAGAERYRELGLTPIFTDATYFVSVLKQHMSEDGHMIGDEQFLKIGKALRRVRRAHLDLTHQTNFTKTPDVLYTAFYHDGLIQSFQRMLALANTGYYSHSCNVRQAITTYEEMLATDETRKALPFYYVFGAKDQPVTLTEFKKLRRKAATLHKAAYHSALKGAQRMTDLVPHHMPYFL